MGNPRYRVWFTTADGVKLSGCTAANAQFAHALPPPGTLSLICYHHTRAGLVLDSIEAAP